MSHRIKEKVGIKRDDHNNTFVLNVRRGLNLTVANDTDGIAALKDLGIETTSVEEGVRKIKDEKKVQIELK